MKKTVGILLFDEVEVLDFAGPFEVFSSTAEACDEIPFDVITISMDGNPVSTVNNLVVVPHFSFDNHPPIDILVLPGGTGTRKLLSNERFLQYFRKMHSSATLTLSVCSGARILGKLGLLDHKRYCTHHDVYHEVAGIAPLAIPQPDKRFVRTDTKLFTSGGISAGIDLSLHIVGQLLTPETAHATARYMEYEESGIQL
jgi:transcriptional regulator GlxA family with amidase domain